MSRKLRRWLLASAIPKQIRFVGGSGSTTLEAAAAPVAGDKPPLRKFKMDAYNGGAMRFWWSRDPVIVDLAGMEISDKARPILKDHDPAQVVGHSEKITLSAKNLRIDGVFSGTGPAATEVVANADNGFPWQASIGADVLSTEEVGAGIKVKVNARTFTGPCVVVRKSRLSESSVLALGADDSTEVRIAAGKLIQPQGKPVKHKITLAALMLMAAAFPHCANEMAKRAEVVTEEGDETEAGETALRAWAETQHVEPEEKEELDAAASLKASRKAAADETRRIDGIKTVCANKHGAIEAKAIEEGWSKEKAELEVLRAGRTHAPNLNLGAGGQAMTGEVLEAAACQAGRVMGLEKRFEPKVLEAASRQFKGRMGLNELIIEAARANGYAGRSLKVDREILRAAFAIQAGGFSTIDISGILSNVANKSILDSFMAVDQSWRKISAIAPVSDFKAITRYRMTGDNTYELVNAGGEIKHGKLDEESFTNQAKTYAKMLAITRNDLRNDDLGVLNKVPSLLGRGGGLKLNDVFWTEYLAGHSTFFPTDGSKLNYIEGAGTVLSLDSMTTMEQLFLDQVDADGKPLGLSSVLILVPTGLKTKAETFMKSLEVRDTTASTKIGVANPHAGKWEVVCSPYLNKAAMGGGYSTTAWYLIANPLDIPVIETCFLDGVEVPTIETAEADFSTLGIQMRGFHDFGVTKQDYRAAAKSKGAA